MGCFYIRASKYMWVSNVVVGRLVAFYITYVATQQTPHSFSSYESNSQCFDRAIERRFTIFMEIYNIQGDLQYSRRFTIFKEIYNIQDNLQYSRGFTIFKVIIKYSR